MVLSNLPRLQATTIDGVDVSSFIAQWEIPEVFDSTLREADIILKNTVSTVLDFNNRELTGATVTVKRGVSSATETNMFSGYIRKIEFERGLVSVLCEDKLSEAKYTVVNTSFHIDVDPEAGVISEIFKTLVNDNTSLTANNTSVVNTGTVNVRKKFILKQRNLMDALMELAYMVDYQIYYDPIMDLVYFQPKGFTTSSTILTVGDNVIEVPKWDIDSTKLFNKITVKGSQQEIVTSEGSIKLDGIANSDWNTTSITLTNKPVSVKVFSDLVDPPTTEKLGGIDQSTESNDYEIDVETKRIIWTTDFAPTVNHFALVEYSYNVPVQIIRKDDDSITRYTGGIAKAVSQFREDIKTVDDAAIWGEKQLAIYSVPFYKTKLKVIQVPSLSIGSIYTVVDNLQGVSRPLMAKAIKYTYPYRFDEVEVADKIWRTSNWGTETSTRIKRLEEKNAETETLITTMLDFSTEYKPRPRYLKIEKETVTSDMFILGHPSKGILGTSKLGGSFAAATTEGMIQGDMTYEEYVYDNDFHDSGGSTATFDITDGAITAFADAGGGDVTVTSAGHGLSNGDKVKIDGSDYYDGSYVVSSVAAATFDITVTFVSTEIISTAPTWKMHNIAFTSGQVWLSEAIDIGTTLISVTLTLGNLTGTAKIEVSSDGKSSWQEISEGIRTILSSSDGTGTYIRITENAASTLLIENSYDTFGNITHPVVKMIMEAT